MKILKVIQIILMVLMIIQQIIIKVRLSRYYRTLDSSLEILKNLPLKRRKFLVKKLWKQ